MKSFLSRHAKRNSSRTLFFLIKLGIAAGIMTLLIHRIKLDEISTAIQQSNHYYIFIAFSLLFLNLFFQLKRWELLVKLAKPDASSIEIFSSLMSGFTLGFITPGRVGEFGRAFFIKNSSWPKLLGFTVFEKLMAISIVYFTGVIGVAYFFYNQLPFVIWICLTIGCLLLCLLFIILLVHAQALRRFMGVFSNIWMKNPRSEQFVKSLDVLALRSTLRVLLFTICQTLVYYSQFYFLIKAFDAVPLWQAFLASASIMATKSLLPISFGDLGVRESAAVFYFAKLNVSAAAAFNGAFLLFVINLLIPSLLGVIFLAQRQFFANVKKNPKIEACS